MLRADREVKSAFKSCAPALSQWGGSPRGVGPFRRGFSSAVDLRGRSCEHLQQMLAA